MNKKSSNVKRWSISEARSFASLKLAARNNPEKSKALVLGMHSEPGTLQEEAELLNVAGREIGARAATLRDYFRSNVGVTIKGESQYTYTPIQ